MYAVSVYSDSDPPAAPAPAVDATLEGEAVGGERTDGAGTVYAMLVEEHTM